MMEPSKPLTRTDHSTVTQVTRSQEMNWAMGKTRSGMRYPMYVLPAQNQNPSQRAQGIRAVCTRIMAHGIRCRCSNNRECSKPGGYPLLAIALFGDAPANPGYQRIKFSVN